MDYKEFLDSLRQDLQNYYSDAGVTIDYVVGPFLLFNLFCIGYSVIVQSWRDVFLLLLIGGAVFAAYFSSAILIGWTESAKSGLLAFLHS